MTRRGGYGLSDLLDAGPVNPISRQRPADHTLQRKRTLLLSHPRQRPTAQLPTKPGNGSLQMLCLRSMGVLERPHILRQPLFFLLLTLLPLHLFPTYADPEAYAGPRPPRFRAGAIPCRAGYTPFFGSTISSGIRSLWRMAPLEKRQTGEAVESGAHCLSPSQSFR